MSGDEPGAGDDDAADESGAPPEADTIALRSLAVAALLRRLTLEARRAPAPDFEALKAWVDENGLFASFSAGGFALFDAPPNAWSAEDKEAVEWAAEELQLLSWALGRGEAPALFVRADAAPLLAQLPERGPVEPFSLAARARPLEELEVQRALHETLANAARLEAWARGIAADPSLAADDEELEELLQGVLPEERERITREHGAHGAAVHVLRSIARQLLTDLFEPSSPVSAWAFAPDKLESLDDEALAVFLASAQLRAEALAWLTEGDSWEA